ncbi:MAG TPA: hypothetical protein VFL57_21600 [Bryobacteraceae bacterium]|nr:hypothetical protein [Bryobacteraceae bacterium]
MRSALKVVAVGLFVAGVLAAQSSHGYAFVAPGGVSASGVTEATLHGGGGFEALVWRRWAGVGAEVGWLGPIKRLGSGVGVLSPNGYFHFGGDRMRGIDPFVTVGYTMFFRRDTDSLFNFGAGLNWWFRDKAGLKFEFRDHVDKESRLTAHFWSFCFGVTFR